MFVEEIIKMEEEHKMPYMTSVERVAIKKGKKEGKVEGKVEGKIEGKIEGKKEQTVSIALELIKNGVDIAVISRATGLSIKEIERLSQTVH
ncbi:MAG: hypothetical protein GY940_13175 [bacterium]|nr:hypothetical protein [bacterium]